MTELIDSETYICDFDTYAGSNLTSIIKKGNVGVLQFNGCKNISIGSTIALCTVPDRLKPIATFSSKVNVLGETYQLSISTNKKLEIYAYTGVSNSNIVNVAIPIIFDDAR